MKILTAQQMRDLDRLTIEGCGIPAAILMETAGARVVEAMRENCGSVQGKTVVVICGKGNNGGDGAVLARLLWMRGAARVHVFLAGRVLATQPPARANFEALERLSEESNNDQQAQQWITFLEISDAAEISIPPSTDFVIDALLGTGLTRSAVTLYADIIDKINYEREKCGFQTIAVDLPSGLPSDEEQPIGTHICADLTVTISAPKIANSLPPNCYANGKLVVASIGTPEYLLQNESGAQLNLLEVTLVKNFLRRSARTPEAYKNAVGDVLLIAGSRGKTGAAALAGAAILRAGAGLATIATAQSALDLLVNQAYPEIMTAALPENADGAIAHEALPTALQLAHKKTVIGIGPGLDSAAETTRHFVQDFLARRKTPLVIDADGLNAIAPWPIDLTGSEETPLIITPHAGEMARLVQKTAPEIATDRLASASAFATSYQVITVLKGARTIIAAPNGEVFVNTTGNAGMATAGAGDVLTGIILGCLAQSPNMPLEATLAAVYLHGLAGDLAAQKLGMRSLLASDILAHLSAAILQVGGADEIMPQANSLQKI